MTRHHRRIPALLLALSLSVTALPGVAQAEEAAPQRGVVTYSEAIAPRYEGAQTFSEDLAAVKQGGKWGYIGTDGETVIPFQYDLAQPFKEGLAIVGKASTRAIETWDGGAYTENVYEMGFIDHAGKFTAFQMVDWNSENGATVPYYTAMEYIGDASLSFHNGLVALPGEYANSFYTTSGQPFDSGSMSPASTMNEGLAPGYPEAVSGFGYFNAKGETVLLWGELEYFGPEYPSDFGTEQSYRVISGGFPFNQGLAPVWQYTYDAKSFEETYLLGFINTSGSWVIQPQFDSYYYSGVNSTYQFFGENGLAALSKDGKYGAIDKTGKTVIPFQYEELLPSHEGLMPFLQGGKYGYLSDGGTVAIPAQFEKASGFNNGMAVVYDGTKAYLIDRTGKAVPGADKLDASTYFVEDEDGSKTITSPGTYPVISVDGKYGYGKLEYLPLLPEKSAMDGWAYPEVAAAIEEDLVPTELQSLYLNNITRSEFCDLVVQAISEVTGKSVQDLVKEKTGKDYYAWIREYPFNDTTNGNVIAAYALGIVQGRGGVSFDPYATITRQEAAAFLTRAAKVLGMDVSNADAAPFADSDAVGIWFKDAVNFVHQIDVMSGSGGNFLPAGTYTREQSYITIYRLFKAIAQA